MRKHAVGMRKKRGVPNVRASKASDVERLVMRHGAGSHCSFSATVAALRSRVALALAARMCSQAILRSLSDNVSHVTSRPLFLRRMSCNSCGIDISAISTSSETISPTCKLAVLQKEAVNSTNQSSVLLPQALIVRRPIGNPFAVPSITVVPERVP
jgi:hypothetical protein